MTMAVSVNSVAAILFLVSWALYLVAEVRASWRKQATDASLMLTPM